MKMLKQSHTTFVLLFLKVHRKVWKDLIMIFIEPCSHDRHQPFKCIILFNSHQDDATQVKRVGVIFNFLLFSGNLSSYSLTTENSDCFSGAHFRLLFFFLICLPWVLVVACEIQFPDQGSNPCPLFWEHRILTTGPSGKSRGLLCRKKKKMV